MGQERKPEETRKLDRMVEEITEYLQVDASAEDVRRVYKACSKKNHMERFWSDNKPVAESSDEVGDTSIACSVEPVYDNNRIVGFNVEPVDGTGCIVLYG